MKKIISILVVAMLLATCVFAAVPASAATKTLNIDWSALAYVCYNDGGSEIDESKFLESFEVTKTATSLGVNRIANGLASNSYISTSQFAITATTDYTYEVMAKNNNTQKYSGVPFAIDTDGYVYFAYGSFDNNNDSDSSQSGKSYIISAKGDFDYKYPNSTNNEIDSMYFAKLQLTDGFASMKFEYKGLTVSMYAKDTNGTYVKMGEDVELPEGSKVAIGVFSRDATNNGNRTTTIKDAKITANNDESVKNLVVTNSNGASELKAEISKIEKDYLEVDYTAETYGALKTALASAKTVANDESSTADQVNAASTGLKAAVEALELAEADTAKLEEAIEKAEALKEIEYTAISYKMVMDAVDDAKALLEKADVKQSEINAAEEAINGRIDALIPSGEIAEPEEDEGDDEGDAPATQAPATQAPAAQNPAPAEKKGCGSAVATTAVVVGLVATLGTALVIKKKD